MSNNQDIALIAHLMRRAGFGSNPEELETLAEQGYENTVEQLVNPPKDLPRADQHLLYRFLPGTETGGPNPIPGAANWLYQMVNTQRPLEEKMSLFWHHVFATGNSKVDNLNHLNIQIQMFRDHGLGNYRDLLLRVAQNPAMIFWLDNNDNHKRAPNENWGRELLELFSLGVGNYTEKDVFECARAFTGWTLGAKIPRNPHGRYSWYYEYRPEEHDFGVKTFLGHTGNFNGEDIIDIIVQQPACPNFVARHLYNFFVADEPQVPAWSIEAPGNPEAIEQMAATFIDSGFEIKPVLREMFNSDFFKESIYRKVKSPAEVVVGTFRLTGDLQGPDPRLTQLGQEPAYMGQSLLDPPSVEGWQTGRDWINSGSVVKRINFVADRVSNIDLPGVQSIINRVASADIATTPESLVERCLDLMGPVQVSEITRQQLTSHAEEEGAMSWATDEEYATSAQRVGDMMALIAASTEYQFG
jgi:uncharacterized protein (DUF1800 family)